MGNFYNIKKHFTLLFSLLISGVFYGQTGWSIDQTFNKRVAKTNDFFFRISKRADGKFLFCSNSDKTKLKLLNGDGTVSTTFEVPTNGNITAIAQATSDKMYIGGDFTSMMNVFVPKIARINADGTRDINFLPDTSTQNVYALQEQADGKLLVGRDGSIQRLNADGTIDSSFTAVTTNGIVYSFAILPNGKILAGGVFTTINGTSKNRIVLLNSDGTVDTSFVVGTGFNNDVHIVRVASDGTFYVGGKFTTFKGTTINRIAKINNTGTLDSTFHTSNSGFDNDVWTIEFLNDNKPLIGGLFTTYKGIANNSVLKLNHDGTVDGTFDTGIAQSNGIVYKIIVNSSNNVLLSGTFLKYKDTYTNQAFLANTDGSINNSFHFDERFCIPGISTYAASPTGHTRLFRYPTSIQNDGKILLSNVFFENIFYKLIRLNADGTKDETFNFNPNLQANQTVRDIMDVIVRPNGKIIISALSGKGVVSEADLFFKGLFQLNSDGSMDDSFNTGFLDHGIYSFETLNIALQNDGKLLLYCRTPFIYKGFQANAGVIRILENGNIDISFQNISGTFLDSNGVNIDMLVLPDNKILLYSIDYCANGYGANPPNTIAPSYFRRYSLVKLNVDGTLAHRFENLNVWNNVGEIALINKVILDGNSLIIAGRFNQVNGNLQRSIARIDFDGNFINNLNSPVSNTAIIDNSQVTDILKYNNKFYFTTYSNLSPSTLPYYNEQVDCDINISRANIDGSLDTSFSTIVLDRSNHIFNSTPYSNNFPMSTRSPKNVYFEFNEENKLVVFGSYNTINNEPYIGLSRIIIDENLSTSDNQFLDDNIKCYPNPTTNIINVTTQNDSITQVNIYDMFGRLLKSKEGKTNTDEISIQELPNAIYLVEVRTERGTKTVKVVKE